METVKEIVEFIEERIGNIYFRPLIYGGKASGVETILHHYHELWAEIYGKAEVYHSFRNKLFEELNCGAANFSAKYKIDNSNASELESTFFAVDQWMKISRSLNVAVPYDKLSVECEEFSHSPNMNKKLLTQRFSTDR